MDFLGQSALVLGLTSFALGFSVLAKNVRNKLFLAFGLLATLVSVWSLAFFSERLWPGGAFYLWHLIFNLWLGPAGLAFIRILVRIRDKLSRRILDLSVLVSMSLSIALLLGFDSVFWVRQTVYFSPAIVVFQIVHLMWIDRRLRAGLKRLPKLPTVGLARRSWIYLGGLAVLSISIMDHVPLLGTVIPGVGNIALTAYLFFLSQAITEQRLLNFSALLSRFVVLLAVAFTLTIVYSALVAWIENSPGLFFLNSFIASFLILTLLEPLRTVVRYFTRRLLSQEQRRLESTLEEARWKLAGVMDSGSLFQEVLLTVESILKPEWAALFVLRRDGTKYRRVRLGGRNPQSDFMPGAKTAPYRELLADHFLLKYCSDLKSRSELPVLLDQILENEIDRSASRQQRDHLKAMIQGLKGLGGNLLIPLFDSGKILGFVVMRVSTPPEPWGNNWSLLTIIYPYFEQVAQTLRSMEVYVRQREKERLATLGEMAAGLAHEIRNPLGAIKGAAQFLDPSADRPESRFLRVIVEEVDRLNRVVTQFLDYSKPQTEDFKKVDLWSLIEKTVEMMSANPKPGTRIELGAAMPAHVMAAPGQIQQVLINLIQNGLNALEQKIENQTEGVVRVTLDIEGAEGQKEAIITVEDNGCGIKKENIEKLFIPFYTTTPSGTGLGLSISQKIVEAHKGRIDIATEEGRFTRFSVTLPCVKE